MKMASVVLIALIVLTVVALVIGRGRLRRPRFSLRALLAVFVLLGLLFGVVRYLYMQNLRTRLAEVRAEIASKDDRMAMYDVNFLREHGGPSDIPLLMAVLEHKRPSSQLQAGIVLSQWGLADIRPPKMVHFDEVGNMRGCNFEGDETKEIDRFADAWRAWWKEEGEAMAAAGTLAIKTRAQYTAKK